MAGVKGVEKSLDEVFGKKAPKLPEGGKKFLVEYGPYLVLIGAALSAFSAWSLWNAARAVDSLTRWADELSRAYGGSGVATSHYTVWVWLAVGVSLVSTILYFMAYKPLKERLKRGWDYVFYVALLGVAYSVVMLFIDTRGFGSFLWSLVGSAVGFWLLFQIRPAYKETVSSAKK